MKLRSCLFSIFLSAMATTASRAEPCDSPAVIKDRHAIVRACSAIIDQAESSTETLARAYEFRGRAFRVLNRKKEARADAQAGLAHAPHHAGLLALRGGLRFEDWDIAGAWEDATEAARLAPGEVRPHVLMISIALYMKDFETVGTLIEHAMTLDPGSIDLLRYRASYHEERGEIEKAIAALDEILRSERKVEVSSLGQTWYGHIWRGAGSFRLQRAELILRLGDYTRAEAAFDEVVALHRSQVTLAERANFKLMIPVGPGLPSRLADALEDADAALAADPRYHRAHRVRSQILTHMRKYPDALKSIEAAIKLEGASFYFWDRGIIKRALGDHDGAADDFVISIAKNSNSLPRRLATLRKFGYFHSIDMPTEFTPELKGALKACALDERCW